VGEGDMLIGRQCAEGWATSPDGARAG